MLYSFYTFLPWDKRSGDAWLLKRRREREKGAMCPESPMRTAEEKASFPLTLQMLGSLKLFLFLNSGLLWKRSLAGAMLLNAPNFLSWGLPGKSRVKLRKNNVFDTKGTRRKKSRQSDKVSFTFYVPFSP